MADKQPVYAEHFPYKVYKLRGITYVPHYKNPDAYVGPGYPNNGRTWYTSEQLLAAGAQESAAQLLSRATVASRDWND